MGRPYHYFKYNKSRENKFTSIAHRGASAYYPENTLAAFEAAIELGADMVEFDVQLSRDREVVVFHDEKISRCTSGRGRISDYALTEVKKLDAGSWFGNKFKGATIPTLHETLAICKDKIAVNIEIKTEAVTDKTVGGIEEKCLKIVEQSGMRDHVIFSSFDPRAIKHLREIESHAATAVLFEKKHYGKKLPSEIVTLLGADCFNCSHKELNKKWLEDLEVNGVSVNVYTVDAEKKIRRLLKAGVEGIFSNKPDVLKKTADDFFRLGN